jgi:hypothetical protein
VSVDALLVVVTPGVIIGAFIVWRVQATPAEPIEERLAAEEQRTGIGTRVQFNQSSMMWEGRWDGGSGMIEGHSQRGVRRHLFEYLKMAPDAEGHTMKRRGRP